ncbi:1,4-dihydroxy-2-naphthoate octaprenyltransferase [Flavobacterium croceum]|uniref:1,4-dihydroxy-2-naphthoate octaprenyltransferase n=1 Tax=Flavobacterium croceum TaxID=370975 RepID=UPI0024A9BDAE|nr:1,4-dihydroxy-2-naphthoate octaprenyltransferase [Flavobacterium croceum]
MRRWIEAARVRTLPLSVSGILVGSFFAMSGPEKNWKVLLLALSTTIGLQILSNFANDYGDGVKGTDNDDRVGPKRAIQSGAITPESMKFAMFITGFLTLVSAMSLIYVSFKGKYLWYSILFFVLGILAIASAIRYTIGKNPYGYRGYGDVFVFIFFGFVSTIGISFMILKEIEPVLFLPATAIGFLSVGVLNLNNMRDALSDEKSGKNTLVVQNGIEWARKYHFFLIISAMVLLLVFAVLFDWYFDADPEQFNIDNYFFLIFYILLFKHVNVVKNNTNSKLLDPELKKVAIATFLISLTISLQMIYLFSDYGLYLLELTLDKVQNLFS